MHSGTKTALIARLDQTWRRFSNEPSILNHLPSGWTLFPRHCRYGGTLHCPRRLKMRKNHLVGGPYGRPGAIIRPLADSPCDAMPEGYFLTPSLARYSQNTSRQR